MSTISVGSKPVTLSFSKNPVQKTRLQTVHILFRDHTPAFLGMELCPILHNPTGGSCRVWISDSDYLEYDAETKETVYVSPSSIKTWYPVPTFADAVNSYGKGEFYEFHGDGTVIANYYGSRNYWSPPIHAVSPITGRLELPYKCGYCPIKTYGDEVTDCYCENDYDRD